jgi:hypothetical protein
VRRIGIAALALGACAWWQGSPEGSAGRVSAANGACGGLFCTAEESVRRAGSCTPSCACRGYRFAEPAYDEADLHALRSWRLVDPPTPLHGDPYDLPEPPAVDGLAVCAAIPVSVAARDRAYRLETFRSEDEAHAAGGQVTHAGACGACSSLQDLAVYIEHRDLTAAGRECGLLGTVADSAQRRCLEGLGLTPACAQIWSFNVDHTRSACLGVCVATMTSDNNMDNGDLNACLNCDEERSGPVFQAVAGRTRRRSGLSSAIARPCLHADGTPAVYPVEHYYFR